MTEQKKQLGLTELGLRLGLTRLGVCGRHWGLGHWAMCTGHWVQRRDFEAAGSPGSRAVTGSREASGIRFGLFRGAVPGGSEGNKVAHESF